MAAEGRRGMVAVIAIVSGLAPLNSATVLVALPAVAAGLRVQPAAATWAVSVYLVATTGFVAFAGPVADRFGRRRVVLAALTGLGISSLAAAASAELWQLVLARILQALCAASTVPAAMALVREHVPLTRRARAFGVVTMTSNSSGVIAPLVGAAMVATTGWRGVFAFNVPLAAVVFLVGVLALPRDASFRNDGSWTLRRIWPRFDLLRRRDVGVSSAAAFFHSVSLYSVLILIPFAFTARPVAGNLPPAVFLVAATVGLVAGAPAGGRLADRTSRRLAAVVALAVAAFGFTIGAVLPGLALLGPLLVVGLGLGAGLPPLQASAVDAVGRQDAAAAASLFLVGRNTGALAGSTVLGLALTRISPESAFAPGMLLMAGSCVLAAVVSGLLRGMRGALPEAGVAAESVAP